MTRRMLKRSRRGDSFSSRDQGQGSGQERQRNSKRSKNTAIDLHLFNPYTSNVFQTPDGEEYTHPSAVTKPLVPEEMSPLPVLTCASSRNYKEYGSASRYSNRKGLASPFSSRHNSASSSPRSRSRKKIKSNSRSKARRPASATKLRSASSNSSNRPSFHDGRGPIVTMNQDMPKSAVTTKSRTLNRYPSSHTLTQNLRQDWLVPPKALKKKLQVLDNIRTLPHYWADISSPHFMLDFPMAFSTPLPSPDQSPPVFAVHSSPANDNSFFCTLLDDITMVPISNSIPESTNDANNIPSFSVAPECDSSVPFIDSSFEPMAIQPEPNHEITFNNHAPANDEDSFENQKELNSLFDELILDPADEGIRTGLKSTFPHLPRTKSLDNDASVLFFPLPPPASTSGRKRAGTIRASDCQLATTTTTSSHALARRTRSGTIVGPNSMNAMKVPTPIISRKKPIPVPKEESYSGSGSDGELVLKASRWKDEDFEYLGLPNPNSVFNNCE